MLKIVNPRLYLVALTPRNQRLRIKLLFIFSEIQRESLVIFFLLFLSTFIINCE
jgi:hypothetical protein